MSQINDFYRGDTVRYKFVFQKNVAPEGDPAIWQAIDITGWKIFFTMKLDLEDLDADAALQVSNTAGDDAGGVDYPDDPVNGVMYVVAGSDITDTLTPDEKYEYDFQRVIPVLGGADDVKTLQSGKVKVLADATRSTV